MHLTGFRSAITRVINDYAKKNNYLKGKDDSLTGDDVREGITAIIFVNYLTHNLRGKQKTN